MNAGLGCRVGSAIGTEAEQPLAYEFLVKLMVEDVELLWHGAARRLRGAGLTPQDIDDTLGPVEDPSLADCLSTLALPDQLPGCEIVDFDLRVQRAAPARVRVAERPSYPSMRPVMDRPTDPPPTAICSLTIGTS